MRLKLGALYLALNVGTLAAQDMPSFERVQMSSHIYDGGWEHFVGGGVASFDCDGDHLPDLYAAGGENPATLFRNRSSRGGDLKFEAETPDNLAMTGVTGAYPINIDGDAHIDLVVLRVGQNKVMKGLGHCRFSNWDAIDLGMGWTTAFSATWENDKGWPTLAIGNYVDRADPDGPFEACDVNYLYRPEGQTYGQPIPLEPGFCALSMLFSDWSLKGSQDLRVSNDRHYYVRGGEEQLWALRDQPRLYTREDGWRSYSLWGMGIASRDITGDGLPELYLTSMGDQKLQSLDPSAYEAEKKERSQGVALGGFKPAYKDATYERGTTAHRPYTGDDGRPSTGWHVAFGDMQNDGYDDIFVAKGNVDQMPGSAMRDPNNLLLQTASGAFVEGGLEARLATMERSRGAAIVDLNLDGKLDIAVVNRRADMELHQNTTLNSGNWLGVRLRQEDRSNRHGVGSRIQLRVNGQTILRELTIGGGHAGGHLGAEHFGLGDAEQVELRVFWNWLSDLPTEWLTVEVNQYIEISSSPASNSLLPSALTATPY